jgi:hypothetical protein
MAKVELLVDSQKLSRKAIDIDVEPLGGIGDLTLVRDQIRAHLALSASGLLRVRLDTAGYKRLDYLAGMDGLTVIHVTLRSELAAIIREQAPAWCDAGTIAELGLLQTPPPPSSQWMQLSADLKILWLMDQRLLIPAIGQEDLLHVLFRSGKRIGPLFASASIKEFFAAVFAKKLETTAIERLFECLMSDNYASQLKALFRQIFHDKIRKFTSESAIQIPLDGRFFPVELTEKLTLTDAWWQTIGPDAELAALTDRVLYQIDKGNLAVERLGQIIWGFSQSQLDKIVGAVQRHPRLSTPDLLSSLSRLNRTETAEAETLIASLLEVAAPAPLPHDSTAKQAMDWVQVYLAHARSAFRREEEPDNEIGCSFSDWATSQSQRFSLSDYNWRCVASTVKDALERGSDVILLVIDAFGAIVSDRLAQRLSHTIDQGVSSRMLFGPLPTLTEYSKLAVACGHDVFQLPSDPLQALRHAYKDVITHPGKVQFSATWKDVNVTMGEMARLMVVYENQFDEQVHKCITNADLDAQLNVVCDKVTISIERWLKGAQGRDRPLEIYISADHGLARVIRGATPPDHLTTRKVRERCVEVESTVAQAPEGYYLLTPEGHGKTKFLVPRDRVKYSTGPERYVHGGILPEEVMIPLITIRSAVTINAADLTISAEHDDVQTAGEGWSVELRIKAGGVRIRRVHINCESPFFGEQTAEHIAEHHSKVVTIHVKSDVPQEGAVNVTFGLRYALEAGNGFQEVSQILTFNFRPHILLRDSGAADFDNMFD